MFTQEGILFFPIYKFQTKASDRVLTPVDNFKRCMIISHFRDPDNSEALPSCRSLYAFLTTGNYFCKALNRFLKFSVLLIANFPKALVLFMPRACY